MFKDLKRVLAESKTLLPLLFVLLAVSITATLLNLITPWLYREMINFLTTQQLSSLFGRYLANENPLTVLMWLVAIYFVINLITDTVFEIRFYLENIAGTKSSVFWTNQTMQRLHQLSLSYFEKTAPGWLRERVMDGIREVFGVTRSMVVEIVPPIVTFLVATYILARFNLTLSFGAMISIPVYLLISIWRARGMRFWQNKIRNQWEKSGRVMMDSIYYISLIKEFSREDYERNRFAKIQNKTLDLVIKKEKFMRLSGVAREVIYTGGKIWVYGYGGYLVLQKQLTIGDLILFISYLESAMYPVSNATRIYDTVQMSLISVGRLFKVWDTKDQVTDRADATDLKVTEGKIKFSNVEFQYPATKKNRSPRPVFRKLNLTISPNEVVALVGPSGVGKSTLIKLLMRFYDPTKGQIFIDGQDIKLVTQRSLRRQIASVMQDTIIFNNTIKYNLKYGKPKATDEMVKRSAKIANLYDFIMSLGRKFSTYVGERGVRLSGGERQRLAIARAVLKDAPILIMDEATSALDSENEKQIQDAMWELIKGRTTIIIAHRLSTVKRADRIIVFDKKGILEQGHHEELMKKSGYYQRLFTMQGELLNR